MTNAMRRDRFDVGFALFDLSNNSNLDKVDKFSKVRPLITHFNKKLLQNPLIEEFCGFDESMSEYFGRHGCKQFIRGKLDTYSFKVQCGTTTLGTGHESYPGKTGAVQSQKEDDCKLGGNRVIVFAKVLQSH